MGRQIFQSINYYPHYFYEGKQDFFFKASEWAGLGFSVALSKAAVMYSCSMKNHIVRSAEHNPATSAAAFSQSYQSSKA